MAVPNTFQTATSAIPLANLDANFTYYDNAFSISGTATTFTGTATATKLIPTGSSATGNGLYLPAANSVGLSTNGTNAVYINSTQNVGIGTSSPSSKLDVRGNASFTGNATLRQTANFGNTGGDFYVGVESSAGGAVFGGSSAYAGIVGTNNATSLQLATNGTIKATIDSSGNLGIGTTSPSSYGKLATVATAASTAFYAGSSTQGVYISNSTGTDVVYNSSGNNAGTHVWQTGNVERARIDSSHNFLVGTTSTSPSASNVNGFAVISSGYISLTGDGTSAIDCNRTNDGIIQAFRRSGTLVGSVSVTTTATAYNTSSDYRLKNTIALMTNALAKVALLKPCTYKWNADGSDGQGFIAHELAEVVPQCVTGEKDAVNEDGSIKSQGIDTSFLVATLTAAMQEQQALITSLTARIEALEST